MPPILRSNGGDLPRDLMKRIIEVEDLQLADPEDEHQFRNQVAFELAVGTGIEVLSLFQMVAKLLRVE